MAATGKVVSLLPSATEIVCALGLAGWLVGRSHECDYPAEVSALPVCTAPNLDPKGTSPEIDTEVKGLLERALSIYRIERETLRGLRPEVVITQTQCEVCAVSLPDVERALADWVEGRPRLISLEPMRLADLWKDIAGVAAALGREARGRELVAALQARVAAVEKSARDAAERPSVACVEWLEPLMAGGNWIPEMVELAGGQCLFAKAGAHSPWLTWEALRAADPDVILLMPCGFDMARTRAEAHWLTDRPGWDTLRAVKAGRVYLTDGNAYFNRSGPRLVDSLEILAEILHPRRFHFGHEGSGWQRLPAAG